MGVGETGVGEMGQIIGKMGVGETGVGEMGTNRYHIHFYGHWERVSSHLGFTHGLPMSHK